MRAAQIALNTRAYAIDRFFTYLIPPELTVHPGMRVTVPFGNGNRPMEGFAVSVSETTETEGLKSITAVTDREPLCGLEEIRLALWMRRRYFCTYYEALRQFLPPGSGLREQEIVALTEQDPQVLEKKTCKSAIQNAVVRFLAENEGVSTVTELSAAVGGKLRPAITALEKKELIRISRKRSLPIREKTKTVVSPADSELIGIYLSENAKKAPAAARILELLEAEGSLEVRELLDGAEAGRASLNRLAEKGLVELEQQTVDRSEAETVAPRPPSPLTEEQNAVLEQIGPTGEYLLCGVTGSGKTEVYLHLIRRVIGEGRQAIMLVPEISLTPQTIRRFRAAFGDRVAVLHSGLSVGERFDSWERIRKGDASVVVGARSAVFAPVRQLGAIIIDEQQEDTYCSEQSPRYDAREVALIRTRMANAVLLQASATPRVEDVYRLRGRVLYLKNRYNSRALPPVWVEDMREELKEGNNTIFSRRLAQEIRANLDRGEQTILFVNRRGHSTFVSCRSCGYTLECPNCSISLKYHSYSDRLMCHYCGYMQPLPKVCPDCGGRHVRLFGLGTQKAEEELARRFPDARILRMDQDTTVRKSAHRRILSEFSEGKADILLGTQMVTKGLDFPNVTLVGVLAADMMLHTESFNAYEEAFAQLTQVFGRAGRGSAEGRAIVQTYQPEHECIRLAAQQDYPKFYHDEIRVRKNLNYPPFASLLTMIVTGRNEAAVRREAYQVYRELTDSIGAKEPITVLNPVPCGIARINRYFRWQVLIKCGADVSELLWRVYDRHRKTEQKTETYLSVYR